MKTPLRLLAVGCLTASFMGCDDKPATTPPQPKPDATPARPAMPPKVSAFKPDYAIAIEESKTEPKTYAVTWSAGVNTGGWTMKTDSVLVEELNGAMAARIYVTLAEPNPADKVTQVAETVTGRHDAGTTKIGRVEFSVQRTVRGVVYKWPNGYSVVKTIKYPY